MRNSIKALIPLLTLALAVGGCPGKKDTSKPITAVSGEVGPPPKTQVPEAVIAWAVAGNPQNVVNQAEKLAALAGPVPSGALGAGITHALVELGLKDTGVIDLAKPAGLLVLDPKTHKIPIVVALTTKGEKAVLESMQPVWKPKEAKDGVHHLTRERLDTYQVFKGGKDAAPPTVTQDLFLKFEGTTALAAGLRPTLVEGAPLLMERLRAGAPANGIALVCQLDNLRKKFQMELQMMPTMAKQQLKSAMASQPQAVVADPEAMEWMLGVFIDKTFAAFQQMKVVGLGVGLEADEAVFHLSIEPEKDSFFAKLLADQKPSKLELAAGLPNEGFVGMAFDVQWQSLKQDLMAFTLEMFEKLLGMPANDELVVAMKEMIAVMGDQAAIIEDFGDDGALTLIELISVTDTERAKTAMAKAMEATSALLSDSGKSMMGMKFEFEGLKPLGKHKGIDLQLMHIKMDLGSMQPQQAAMIKNMYGSGMTMVMAVFDKTLALAMGKNAERDLKATIDRIKSKSPGLTSSKVYRSAAGDLDRGAGAWMFLSISRLAASSIKSTMAMTGAKAPDIAVPPAKSGLFIRFKTEDGRLINTFRLPADHLSEMGEVFKSLSQMSSGRR